MPSKRDIAEDYQVVAETDSGKAVLKDMAKFCFENAATVDLGEHGDRKTTYNEGRRSVILRTRALVAKDLSIERKNLTNTENERT